MTYILIKISKKNAQEFEISFETKNRVKFK